MKKERQRWSAEEDNLLRAYVRAYGPREWHLISQRMNAQLDRDAKSCLERWKNYLKPGIKKGSLTEEEQRLVIRLQAKHGNKWKKIAAEVPGRTAKRLGKWWEVYKEKQQRDLNKRGGAGGIGSHNGTAAAGGSGSSSGSKVGGSKVDPIEERKYDSILENFAEKLVKERAAAAVVPAFLMPPPPPTTSSNGSVLTPTTGFLHNQPYHHHQYHHHQPPSPPAMPTMLPPWLSSSSSPTPPTPSPSVTLSLASSTAQIPWLQPDQRTTTPDHHRRHHNHHQNNNNNSPLSLNTLLPPPPISHGPTIQIHQPPNNDHHHSSTMLISPAMHELVECCRELDEGHRAWAAHRKEATWRLKRVELQLESEKACRRRETMEEIEAKMKALREEQKVAMERIDAEYREQLAGLRRDAEVKEHKLADQWAAKHLRLVKFLEQMGGNSSSSSRGHAT